MLRQILSGYRSDVTPHMRWALVLDDYQTATRIIGVVWGLVSGLALPGA